MSFDRPGVLACLLLLIVLLSGCGAEDIVATDASALERLGLSQSDAERYAVDTVTHGQPYGVVATAGRAFKALSDDDRVAVVEGAGGWARAYLDSDLFRTAYAEHRAVSRPEPPQYDESIDEAVARWAAEGRQQIDEARTSVIPMLAEADRAEMLANLDAMLAQYDDPRIVTLHRQGIELQRADDQRGFEEALARWETELPEDPRELVRRRLRAFLDTCSDVDFDADLEERYGRMRFVDAAYEQKPWEWKLCFRAGEDSVEAARTVAEAWLDELE